MYQWSKLSRAKKFLELARPSPIRSHILQPRYSRFKSSQQSPPVSPVQPTLQRHPIPLGVLGQATCHSHPHLIEEQFLTHSVTQAEYAGRRAELVKRLVEEVPEDRAHVIVIPAACKQYMSDKIPFVFRQNTDFYYLTGCHEPAAALILYKAKDQKDNFKSILFVHERDSHSELWDGPRTGCEAATRLYAVDEAQPVGCFSQVLQGLTKGPATSVLWYSKTDAPHPAINSSVCELLRPGHADSRPVVLNDPRRVIQGIRIIKSDAEIDLMQEACYIGSQAINTAMACTKPGITEHTINGMLEYSCKLQGAEHLAFPPVVAGGHRATTIHYIQNNQQLREDEMLLVDAGCQFNMYNSDISRTWPVSGKFSKHHRILYELVLSTQRRLIELLEEQRPPLDQLFDHMCRILGKHLKEEGIIHRNVDGNELIAQAYQFCPHHVSHYLGMDVHDTSLIKRNIPVRTGMIVTVEPGLYIRANNTSVPKEFRGIGIRVEDDVLITDAEPLVLTESCFKEVDEIEGIVGTQDDME